MENYVLGLGLSLCYSDIEMLKYFSKQTEPGLNKIMIQTQCLCVCVCLCDQSTFYMFLFPLSTCVNLICVRLVFPTGF